MKPKPSRVQLFLAGHDQHAGVQRSNRLDRGEAEHGHVGKAADFSAVVARTEGMGGVVHHPEAVLFGERLDPLVIALRGRVVHDDDGLGARGHHALGAVDVDAQGVVENVAQHRFRVAGHDGLEIGDAVE